MQEYAERRRALLATASPGLASARELAALTDEALVRLAEDASASLNGRWALVALGGYGAGRLLPSSDIDVLLLAEDGGIALREAASALLYPLWDVGLTVGHQVRSRREHLSACRADLKSLTASLTARTVAGDRAYGDGVLASVAADAPRRRARVLAELAARPRLGSQYLLEPDLKEGAGGQRDLDEIVWTAAVLLGEPARDPGCALPAGLLTEDELPGVEHAAEMLASARWDLTHVPPRLTLAAAEESRADPQRIQEALAVAADALERVRERAADAARRGKSRRAATAWDADALFRAALAGEAPALERAAWRGELDALVPPLRALMPLRRPGLSHELTVGAHCLACACAIRGLATAEPTLGALSLTEADVRAMIVAALVHDAGKVVPGEGHALRSVEAVRPVADRLGLSGAQTALAERLVAHHLLLPAAAMRTDAEDAAAVEALADLIGDERTLDGLHLLSAADSVATGHGMWTPWHAELIGALVSAVRAAMRGHARPDAHAELTSALELLPSSARNARGWLAAAPAKYLATRGATKAAADAVLVSDLLASSTEAPPLLAVSTGPAEDTWSVTIAGRERRGLFGELAGVLALAGLDVLSAAAQGWDGVALDSFTVRSATLAPVSHDVWVRVERLLSAAARRHLAIDTRLAERRAHYPTPPAARRAPSVRYDTSERRHTVVEVRAADRPGLLHDLAAALAESGLDIEWAIATVRSGRAIDVFRVTSEDGAHREPGVLGHVSMRVRERLGS